MSVDHEKWERVVRKLTDDTVAGKVTWSIDSSGRIKPDDLAGPVYLTQILGRTVAAYRIRYQEWFDSRNFSWEDDFEIAFVGCNGQVEWLFPKTPSRWDLMETLRYRIAGADEFANTFLSAQR